MKKTKLFGTRIIDNIDIPRTPKVIMLQRGEYINNHQFEDGDMFDANSIKRIVERLQAQQPDINIDEILKKIKQNGRKSDVLTIDSIDTTIYTIDDTNIANTYDKIVYNDAHKKFLAIKAGFAYAQWASTDNYGSSDDYKEASTKIIYNKTTGVLYRLLSTGLSEISSSQIYVGQIAPEDKSKLWIDTRDTTNLTQNDADELKKIKAALAEIYKNMSVVNKIILNGVVAGDAHSSAREIIMRSADPLKPKESKDIPGIVKDKPNTEGIEPTVNHVSIKMDTVANFSKNRQNLIDGEILFYTDKKRLVLYKDGKFNLVGTTDGGSGGSGGGISVEDLYATKLRYLNFTDGESTYKVEVSKSGEFMIHKNIQTPTGIGNPDGSWGVFINHLLCINEVYCGGQGSEDCMCSHNFVELANGSTEDINLNGIYLLYTDGTPYGGGTNGYKWHTLPLSGVIKAGSTYLIRGAKCNDYNSQFIDVNTYDQEWFSNGELIKFSQTCSSFYLCVGSPTDNWVYDSNGNLYAVGELASPWNKQKVNKGYIDSCGFGVGSLSEGGTTFLLEPGDSWNDALFIRRFMLEPAKQGNKAYGTRKSTSLWIYVNLKRQTTKIGNSIQYYYLDEMKEKYTPKASWEGKNFFTDKTEFNKNKPNCIRCTFGIQATSDTANHKKASRCFNWVSVGYYDEFIEYRKKGQTEWKKQYSITRDDSSNSAVINKFIDHYERLRWKTVRGTMVTTHKVVLSEQFEAGVYEYRIGRDFDESYYSTIKTLTVKDNSEVTTFKFVQETDQQGFSWIDYQAWRKSAKMLAQDQQDADFLINTGDITQNGNRENEWLDYYQALDEFLGDKTEMFTVGNNDLCGHNATQLTDGDDVTSKYNHVNVLKYFTFELDPNNEYELTWNGKKCLMYSTYSFNYGKFHFISINSENAVATSKVYTDDWNISTNSGDATFAKTMNAKIEDWLKKDLQIYYGVENPTDCKNTLCYMHEMPFTIVTWDFMNGVKGRSGSHLNTLNNNGTYRFSRLFKKYGIRLVFGGHKHTYSISKPIYDAPADYIQNNRQNTAIEFMGEVTESVSRKPVVQVTKASDINNDWLQFARFEIVDKINAPTYVMSQATGWKLVSNKEQPSGPDYQIPWLLAYFKAKTSEVTPKENVKQHYPMYIVYEMSDSKIDITAKQIKGVWTVNEDKNTAKYDMNKQLDSLSAVAMTLKESLPQDLSAYNITTQDKYTITL